MTPAGVEVEVDGRTLRLSNLDKVLYPQVGFTKAHVVDYYTRIAPVLLPHLRDRPLTLKRYPNGVEEGHFFEKQAPSHRPDWVTTAPIAMSERVIDFVLCDDLPTLVWLANLADLELHPSLARATDPASPDVLAFDLDPGPPATIVECCRVALLLRDVLGGIGLESFCKTSGGKGMQLYVPLNGGATWDATKGFSRAVAQLMTKHHPDLVIDVQDKRRRVGRVLVDWYQNDAKKTTISVYSLRAQPEPTVSTPLSWDEVSDGADADGPEALRFTSEETLARVAEHGDMFAPVLELQQTLPG